MCMAVHSCVFAVLQFVSSTIRFAVWNHSPKSAPQGVVITSGKGSFIGNTIKGSRSHREGRQAVLVLLQSNVLAAVELCLWIWTAQLCGTSVGSSPHPSTSQV